MRYRFFVGLSATPVVAMDAAPMSGAAVPRVHLTLRTKGIIACAVLLIYILMVGAYVTLERGKLSIQSVAHVLSDARCLFGWLEDSGLVDR